MQSILVRILVLHVICAIVYLGIIIICIFK